uniref:Maturase K n=1 Tax=Lomariopsis japurensis TaxID=373558 RepID=A0A5B9RC34_9MONI|nr:maturase K [Lomariopsis japurensis]QEG57414.1 maturase K [Lomariopsis japurensis]
MRRTFGSSLLFDASHRSEELITNKEGLSINWEKLNFNQDWFPYLPLFLLRDDSYQSACKSRLGRQDIGLNFEACSAVTTKRSIDSMRYQDYSEILYSEFVRKRSSRFNVDLYLHVYLQTICLILGISLLNRLTFEVNNNTRISQSIHSMFLFLEDRLPKSSHVFGIEMVQNPHLETLVRLFRRQIKDVAFLHIVRIVLYAYKISYGRFIQPQFWKRRQQESIDRLLRNFYTYEIDSILLLLWTRMSKLQLRYFVSIDKNLLVLKRRCISTYSVQLDGAAVDQYPIRSLCIHLGRYKNKSIIAFHGVHYFVKRWIHFILIFLKLHLHYPTRSLQIRSNLLSTSSVLFLDYVLTIQSVSKDVQIETMMRSCKSTVGREKIFPRIPTLLLVKLLEKEKFCDSTGCPVSRLAWTGLADDEILNNFVRIWNTFSLYHSAVLNKNGLRRLRYIPRISCDSTLAGKHRSTIRSLRRRFDLELPKMVSAYNKLNLPKKYQRVWYLKLIRSVSSIFSLIKINI